MALYDKTIEVFYDNTLTYQKKVPVLLPYQTQSISFDIPYGLFGKNMPSTASILFDGQQKEIYTSKREVIIRHTAVSGITVCAALLFLLVIWKKEKIYESFAFIKRRG